MKKTMGICLLLLLFLAAQPALAASDFEIDKTYTFSGMNRSYALGYEPMVQNHVMTLCVPILSRAEGKIEASLRADDEAASPFRAAAYTASFTRSADGTYRVKLELTLDKSRKNGDYPATLTLTGTDAAGGAVKGEMPFLIRIRDGAPSDDLGAPEIKDIAATLRVGEDATLTATLVNASKTKEMTGLTLSVSDSSGDILPVGAMPIKLIDLKPGEQARVSVPLSVRGNAAVSLHTLSFTVSYRALSQSFEVKSSYTLPVTQDMRLKQGGVQMPSTIVQGDLCSLTLPLMNMGKGELRNVLATLTLPDVAPEQSVLVGGIAAGETKQAKMSFTAGRQALGEKSGTLLIAYEDAYGNADSFILPLSLTVEAPPALALSVGSDAASADDAGKTPLIVWGLGGGCGALLLALIVQGAILKRKLEEERL